MQFHLIVSLELTSICSTEAIHQTDGFPHAFMLAFNDPDAAETAYKQFQEGGLIPDHGCGPWVIFIGRQPCVFTS